MKLFFDQRIVITLCWVALLAPPSTSYRILGFFPFPASSHHNVIAPILHKLALRGHQVVYLTPVVPKFNHFNLEVRPIKPFLKEYLDALELPTFGVAPMPIAADRICSAAHKTANFFYADPEAQKIIHGSDEFDAVMMESALSQEPASALIHKFGCVGIELATLGDQAWLNELSGLPDNPSYQMDFKTEFSNVMTFWERLKNFYSLWSTVLVNYYHLSLMQKDMDMYFNYTGWETRPPLSQLVSNRSIVLINSDVLTGYPVPLAPHAKQIGGVVIVPDRELRELPQNVQKFMDEATTGVILFSMGSNLNTSEITTSQFGKAFVTAFSKVPQKIIMKWESNDIPDFLADSNKFLLLKWLPQQEILAHANCRMFVTHGGLHSTTEAVYYGVPLVVVPNFGDQMKNAQQIKLSQYGVMLKIENVTDESARWAVEEVFTNIRYRDEAIRRSQIMKIMRYKRADPLDDAAFWVEFGIRYPNFLTPRSASLSFIVLHQLDVYASLLFCLFIIYKVISSLVSFTLTKVKPKKKDKRE